MNISTVGQYNSIAQHQTLHPLVSIIDFSKLQRPAQAEESKPDVQALTFGFYAVFFKQNEHCIIRYGRKNYDYTAGTLIFIAPGQVVSIEEDGDDYQPDGFALLFHPDLIKGTMLGQHIKDYTFFSYHVREALHLSEEEKKIVMECLHKIEYELKHAVDKHSKKLIVSNVELFLDYCVRFYDRQFITRDHADHSVLEKFENLLAHYFDSDKPQTTGIPTVAQLAGELHLSPNYFGDLVKKETGKTAQEHIKLRMIEVAKEKMAEPEKTFSEIAYELGFKYPQHFTRFFKQHVGQTPNEYRLLN